MYFEEKRKLVTTWSVTLFWVLFSFAVGIGATYSFIQADWVIRKTVVISNYYHENYHWNGSKEGRELEFSKFEEPRMGYFSEQKIEQEMDPPFMYVENVHYFRFGVIGLCQDAQCRIYGEHDPISFFIWRMVTLVGGAGCVTLCVSAVLSVLAVALPTSQLRHRVATTIGHAQAVSVVLLFLSLLLFPLGFQSEFMRTHCGPSAGPFDIADCEVGWAYALLIVSVSLALYCPILSSFTADFRYESLPKYL